jgi:hypothetical protein
LAEFPLTVAAANGLSARQADAELEFVASMYRQRRRGVGTAFHTRSVQVARSLLWLLDRGPVTHGAWFDNVWFSDVVKCSTVQEMGSPGINDLAGACRPLLERELRTLGPTLVATLGTAAADALTETHAAVENRIAVPHPSGFAWRAITDPTHDDWLKRACDVLGLDWGREGAPLQQVRETLRRDPWGTVTGVV